MIRSEQVTIEILKESQPSRPRKWIPWYCLIALLLAGLPLAYYILVCVVSVDGLSEQLLSLVPDFNLMIGNSSFDRMTAISYLFIPVGLVVLNIFPLVAVMKMAKRRHIYRIFSITGLIFFILNILYLAFVDLHIFIDAMDGLFNLIPADAIDIIVGIFPYVTIGYSAIFLLGCLFGLFYNVNYPAKYEGIYKLRKARINAYQNLDDRIAYKKRFYNDYKEGNWDSMMLDLHFEALQRGSKKAIRRDAYEFMIDYAGRCDANVKRAVFDAYAGEGRYFEARNIFYDIVDKSNSVNRGAKIVIPHYVDPKEATAKPKPTKAETPKRIEEGKPSAPRKSNPQRIKRYSPDDI